MFQSPPILNDSLCTSEKNVGDDNSTINHPPLPPAFPAVDEAAPTFDSSVVPNPTHAQEANDEEHDAVADDGGNYVVNGDVVAVAFTTIAADSAPDEILADEAPTDVHAPTQNDGSGNVVEEGNAHETHVENESTADTAVDRGNDFFEAPDPLDDGRADHRPVPSLPPLLPCEDAHRDDSSKDDDGAAGAGARRDEEMEMESAPGTTAEVPTETETQTPMEGAVEAQEDPSDAAAAKETPAKGPEPEPEPPREYYAVRVGYVRCPACAKTRGESESSSPGDGGGGNEATMEERGAMDAPAEGAVDGAKEGTHGEGKAAAGESNGVAPAESSSSIAAVIRSAIFLRWEDVEQFVEFQKFKHSERDEKRVLADGGASKDSGAGASAGVVAAEKNDGDDGGGNDQGSRTKATVPINKNLAVEYRVFHSLERAEKYLRIAMDPNAKDKKRPASALYHGKKKLKMKKKHKRSSKFRHPPPKPVNHRPPSEKWMSMYELAKQYKDKKGHIWISSNDAEHHKLYQWLTYQKSQYKLYLEGDPRNKHTLNREKVKLLKEIGFAQEVGLKTKSRPSKTSREGPRDDGPATKKSRASVDESELDGRRRPRQKWMDFLEKMREYYQANGTFTIPSGANGDEGELRKWWRTQLADYRKWDDSGGIVGPMSQEKLDLITGLGYSFPPSWNEMYSRLRDYKAVHGSCKVAVEDDPQLAEWAKKQKDIMSRHLRGISAKITEDQATKLVDIGLAGVPKQDKEYDTKWNAMFEQLKAYKQLNGDCNVPTNSGTELGYWVMAQRRYWNRLSQGKTGKRRVFLDAMKIHRLTQLGFQFCPKGSYVTWEDRIKELKEFRDLNGHCRVPIGHTSLGDWVSKTRRDYKLWKQGEKSSMTPERERELMELGFVFEAGKTPERREGRIKSWEERFEDLKAYKELHGHTVVPQNAGALGQWVHAQRVNYKKIKNGKSSSLSAEKALKLAEIGFVFNASDRSFRGRKQKRDEVDNDINNITDNIMNNNGFNTTLSVPPINTTMNGTMTTNVPNNMNMPPNNYYYTI